MADERLKRAAQSTRKAFGTDPGPDDEAEKPSMLERILNGLKDTTPLDEGITSSLKKIKKK